MKKQIVALITCFVVCITFVLNGFTSSAAYGTGSDYLDFYVPYSRPEGDGVGYVSVILQDKNDSTNTRLITLAWSLQPYASDDYDDNEAYFGLVNIDDGVLTLELNNTSSKSFCVYSLVRYTPGEGKVDSCDLIGVEEWYTRTFNYSQYGYNMVGFECGGNAVMGSFDNNGTSASIPPRIHWGGDNSLKLLGEVVSLLGQGLVPLKLYLPKLSSIDLNLSEIKQLLDEMYGSLSGAEQEKIDDFVNNSTSQSGVLSDLNNQTSADKIDVDSTSQNIDSNLNISTDANYGLLLSSITGNSNILTMLLACASIALISYVLFGKR